MGANDVESEPSQDREVLWGVVLSGLVAVLAEDDIEQPKSVLDAPITAHCQQQPLGGGCIWRAESSARPAFRRVRDEGGGAR
jgi:hypothetical protein